MTHKHKKHERILLWSKLFVLFIPLLPMIGIYFVYDPDMILKKYKRFDQTETILSEGYVGWENYMNNRDSIDYDSFIMGNSCTMAFRTDEWEKYLPNGSNAIRFFENGESLGGFYQKMEALNKANAKLRHILLVFDSKSFSETNPSQNVNQIFSYEMTGMSQINFIAQKLQSFLMPKRCLPFLEYQMTRKYSKRMKNVIITGGPIREPYTNNFLNPREREIIKDGEKYWDNHQNEFLKTIRCPEEYEAPTIKTRQKEVLLKIKDILDKNGSRLTMIISPDYNQKKFNRQDLSILNDLFGEKCIYDFSGNNIYTQDYHHYYEPGHYRPCLGEKLLKQIYSKYERQ